MKQFGPERYAAFTAALQLAILLPAHVTVEVPVALGRLPTATTIGKRAGYCFPVVLLNR